MTHDRLRVLTTCGVFEPGFRGGGVVRAVVETVDTASDHVDVTVVTRDRDLGSSRAYPGLSGRWTRRHRSRVFYLDVRSPFRWLRLGRELRRTRFDLLYVNSMWTPTFTVLPVLAARLGLVRARKILVSPHGQLSPGALAIKSGKKRMFLKIWAPFLRRTGVIWHAVTEREASEIRAVCPWARIVVHHQQTSLPDEPMPPQAPDRGPARLVFVGRIAPIKNLDLVLDALCRVSSPVVFDIYGPLEDAGYWSRCRVLIDRLPANVVVRYRGEVDPADVRLTFSRYDAFAFPTLGENFGYVVAESLSASCPVLCSDQTPWSAVLAGGGGLVLESLGAAELAKELERIATMSPGERLRARKRAGDAYRRWRQGVRNENLLDRVRQADWWLPGGGAGR